MAIHVQEPEQDEVPSLMQLTTEIVAAYVSQNTVAMADLGRLIDLVGRQLRTLGREEEQAPAKPEPAVPVRRSVREDHLVCLVCGRRQTLLRPHLDAAHQLTPQAYRELFGLKRDYPMTAPGYSRQRAELARLSGLGRRIERSPRRRQRKSQG